MTQQRDESAKESAKSNSPTDDTRETGDPGRTPGAAEGDEATVDESLRQQEDGEKPAVK